MYQYTTILGNVGRDPELRYTPNGIAVCDFSVAVNRRWKDKDSDETKEQVTWFRVTCWRGLAEIVNQYVSKGRQVLVTGDVSASAWIGQDGEAKATLELTARDVKFLGKGGNGGYENPTPPEEIGTGDIPF